MVLFTLPRYVDGSSQDSLFSIGISWMLLLTQPRYVDGNSNSLRMTAASINFEREIQRLA